MYIDPFWGGVLTTVGTEIAIVFVAAIIAACRRTKK